MTRTSDTLLEAKRAFDAGDHDAAVRLFKQMIKVRPESAELWHNLGQAYQGASKFVKAADAFDKAATLDPTFALPLNGLGMLSRLAGNLVAGPEVLSSGAGSATNFPRSLFQPWASSIRRRVTTKVRAGTMKTPFVIGRVT